MAIMLANADISVVWHPLGMGQDQKTENSINLPWP